MHFPLHPRVEKALFEYCEHKHGLHMSLGIVRHESVETAAFGNGAMDLPGYAGPYEIGSITKTLTAGMYANAMAQRKVSLTDTILGRLTVTDVLTHTSGIREMPMNRDASGNPFSGYDKDDIMRYIAHCQGDPSSDGTWSYSNLGYALAGAYLETIYGCAYAQLLENHLSEALCLKHTEIGTQTMCLSGYDEKNNPINWTWQRDDAYIAAGGLISTLDDMLKYLCLQMNESKYAICHQVNATTPAPFDMGLAWMIEKGTPITFCMGLTYGFSSFIGFRKDTETGIVILSNHCSMGYDHAVSVSRIGLEFLRVAS